MTKFTRVSALALVASLATLNTAQAKDWYLGGSIGYNQTSDQTSEGQGLLVETEFDGGIATTSIIGLKMENNVRLEGEFAWRRNDGDSLAFQGNDQTFTARGAQSYSLLANVFYDLPIDSSITPYIGVGAGIGFLENEFLYGAVDFEDKDTAFVYQGIIGASLPITEKITGFIDARYFTAKGVDFVRTSPADNGVSLDSEYDNFSISVGYRWNL